MASTSTAPPTDPFATLRHGLSKTLAEFAAATAKERALGGKAAKDGKQKASTMRADVAAEQVAGELEKAGEQMDHYFFPKYLTSRPLLELEVSPCGD